MTETTAVLLAAGAGTRLGRGPKALLPYRGGTLVEHLAGVLRAGGCADIVIVVGAGAHRIIELWEGRGSAVLSACRLVVNGAWESGMGGSFALGVGAAAAGHDVLVALVDQPGLTPALVARLLAAHRPGRVTAAGYLAATRAQGNQIRRGHPVLFDAALARRAAASADADAGARAFLRGHPDLIDLIDCTDLSDGADVDTPADLHLLPD
ncbi:nicotine blue oxidoreductase [Specibacter cremeus]|uniref:nicotine blue oxidoreductase n=1 Tax=Specibacter cremeus TaxID=1629051 RepID=UPI000F78A1F6|nr:NTP transferase domain-containing protein [Specibacter cremeus]